MKVFLGIAAASLAMAGCSRAPEHDISNVDALARSLSIIRGGTQTEPTVLRILFYGQSISSTKWTEPAVEALRKMYPNTRFVVANMAIGGFDADLLERTAARDVTEFYPDLVVFHVYGDPEAYERIIRTIRSRTAAEVILQTDHVTEPVEPMCDEGVQLTFTPPPGCKGALWYRQNSWEQHMSGKVVPDLARQYGLAVEDRRPAWNAYLQSPGCSGLDQPHCGSAHRCDRETYYGERSPIVSIDKVVHLTCPTRRERKSALGTVDKALNFKTYLDSYRRF